MKEYALIPPVGSTRFEISPFLPTFRYIDITIQYHEGLWNYGFIHLSDGGLITFAPTHWLLPTSNIHEEIKPNGHLVYCITGRIPAFVLNRATMSIFFIPKRKNQDFCQWVKYNQTWTPSHPSHHPKRQSYNHAVLRQQLCHKMV